MKLEFCNVVGQHCAAPPGVGLQGVGWAEGETKTRLSCYRCGLPVCSACSSLIRYFGALDSPSDVRRRICDDCQIELGREREVRVRQYRRAGYTDPKFLRRVRKGEVD